jgi:cyclic pyranopterin phosphate synthase
MIDQQKRTIDYVRFGLTDQCQFRCSYCMPQKNITFQPSESLLTWEEILRIATCMATLGIQKVKLTGGEPLLREGIFSGIKALKKIQGIKEVTLTTNGFLLEDYIEELVNTGIRSINISLDTLKRDRFLEMTKVDGLDKVLRGMRKAINVGCKVKLNVVAMQSVLGELKEMISLAKSESIAIRFIEPMPIGRSQEAESISKEKLISEIEKEFGEIVPLNEKQGNGPATYWKVEGLQGVIGYIGALSHCFCDTCNRVRITPTGFLKPCLYYKEGIDLKTLVREGIDDTQLIRRIENIIYHKPKQHAFGQETEKDSRWMSQIGG